MMKLLKRCVIFLLVVLGLLLLFRNFLVKVALEQGVRVATGLTLQVEAVDIPLTRTAFGVRGVKLFNPPAFADPVMLDVPEVYVAYDLPAILKKDLHFQEVRLHLEHLTVVRGKDGVLNLEAFKKFQPAGGESAPPSEGALPSKKSPPPALHIDLLVLKAGRVSFKDYSKAAKVEVREFDLNLDERMENIRDTNALVQMVILRTLSKTDLGQVLGPDLQAVGGLFGQAFKSTKDLTTGTLKSTTGMLKNTVQGVTGILGAPFKKDQGGQ